MKLTDMTLVQMCTTTEKQSFDRKSAKIDATANVSTMRAFANSDGGLLAVSIEDNGDITRIDDYAKNVNLILKARYDFSNLSIFLKKK
jgi:ATP-dependent DNA helicase RecG